MPSPKTIRESIGSVVQRPLLHRVQVFLFLSGGGTPFMGQSTRVPYRSSGSLKEARPLPNGIPSSLQVANLGECFFLVIEQAGCWV